MHCSDNNIKELPVFTANVHASYQVVAHFNTQKYITFTNRNAVECSSLTFSLFPLQMFALAKRHMKTLFPVKCFLVVFNKASLLLLFNLYVFFTVKHKIRNVKNIFFGPHSESRSGPVLFWTPLSFIVWKKKLLKLSQNIFSWVKESDTLKQHEGEEIMT